MSNDNLFLSENFDFIEESTPFTTEPLEFQDVQYTNISESKGNETKYKIIGKVRGCMAPIGVYSRNHRIYENSHWAKVLSNPTLQERLATRSLYGMPSHMQKPIDDEDFREGRISHIVSVLEVRNDESGKPFLYGEFDILDTPAGRILKAMYEGGAGIYVSTRAAGKLLPIPGDPVNKRVSADSYYLNSIDCVLNPGFLQARPTFEAVSDVETPAIIAETPVQESETSNVTAASESSEVSELKTQIEKLACVVEKVVDDMYKSEQSVSEEVQKQPIVEPKKEEKRETKELKCETKLTEESKAALISALMLLSELNVSEEALKEALDIMEDKLKG